MENLKELLNKDVDVDVFDILWNNLVNSVEESIVTGEFDKVRKSRIKVCRYDF